MRSHRRLYFRTALVLTRRTTGINAPELHPVLYTAADPNGAELRHFPSYPCPGRRQMTVIEMKKWRSWSG